MFLDPTFPTAPRDPISLAMPIVGVCHDRGRRWLVSLKLGMLFWAMCLLQACSLPALTDRESSFSLSAQESADTALGHALDAAVRAHPGKSAVFPVADALDAFVGRMLMTHFAERTLDVQYYIWRNDTTGILLLNALKEAADRGVRVRLLLDDNGISNLDDLLMDIHQHPQIEVRLFNPFPWRTFKRLGYVFDFSRLNRRMHNKSMTVDGQLTLIGGRNIGDEYFGASDGLVFADLDVLAAGPIVNDVANDFDLYWNSRSAYPLDVLSVSALKPGQTPLQTALAALREASQLPAYLAAVKQGRLLQSILTQSLPFEWAPVRMVSDDPAKIFGKVEPDQLFPAQMFNELGTPTQSLDLVSPYFVPTAAGTTAFSQLLEKGVRVRVLTNSLEATDVSAVHAGYAKRRKDLLNAGVSLFETRKLSPEQAQYKGGWGSSSSSLHAKTFVVDAQRVFVGSFNFDPRSANLNTELGFVIESPSLAAAIAKVFDEYLPTLAYRLALSEEGKITWTFQHDGQAHTLSREPGTSWLTQLWIGFLAKLPIESLL